jgi:hypothetical protein
MRDQTKISQGARSEPAQRDAPDAGDVAKARLDWFELAVLGAFALVSVWVLALDLWHVIGDGRVWTGADSFYGVDQYQYLAWVQEASRHVLVSNLFVLHSTPASYFQPAIVISGGLSVLGLAPSLSLLLWKPVAVVALFYAIRQYGRHTLPDREGRRAALVLALFFGSFTVLYGSVETIGDLFPGFLAWGYPFALLGLAAMVAALLTYDSARARDGISWTSGLLGAAASSLHPWHGALLIAVVLGGELAVSHRRVTLARLAQPVATVWLTALPLAYYVALGRIDVSWRLARAASKHGFPLWSIALELGPLLLPAVLAYRQRPRSFLVAATMVWPLAAFAEFGLSMTPLAATPLHAFQGITIPLSVLAIWGLRRAGFGRLPHRLVWGSMAVAMFTIPATIWQLNTARRMVAPQTGNSNFITRDEHRALRYLARDPHLGGVISRLYLGQLVPGETGRHTFVGDCLWSEPHCSDRLDGVRRLFQGRMTPAAARRFVRSHEARFILADCRQTVDLGKLLGPVVVSVNHFGCAKIYEVG